MKFSSKPFRIGLASLALLVAGKASALTVIDPAHIKISLLNAKKDFAQQLLMEANQKTQIFKLNYQIGQVEEYLRRLGNPEDVDLLMLREIIEFLNRNELNKRSGEIVKNIGEDEAFQIQPEAGPYEKVDSGIIIDGKVVAKRSGAAFESEVAARRTLAGFREVKDAVLLQRAELKKQISQTMNQLQLAKTSSEVQKISALLGSLQAQLAATDSEISFAADEVLTRFLHNQNEKAVAEKARVQKQRVKLRVGTEKDLSLYRLSSKPFFFPR